MQKVLIVLSLFVVAGCASAKNAPPLVETNHDTVRNCRQVAKFRSEAGKKYWGPPPVLGNFKYESAVKAKEMGATHIYWMQGGPGMDSVLTGWAVDCTGVEIDDFSGGEWQE